MEKIKNYKYLALFIAGLVVAVGFTVSAQSGGLETIKDAVIALTAKVLELESRMKGFEESGEDEVSISDNAVGGVSSFDQVDVAWINTGNIASTTPASGTWQAKARLTTTGSSGDADDYWKNDTGGNVFVKLDYVHFFGNASSGMAYYVATSSDISLTNFSFAPTAPSAVTGQTNTLLHLKFATSTKDHVITATSTSDVLLRPTEKLVLEVIQSDSSCGTDQVHGACEFATSTNIGFDLQAVFTVTGTSTPKEQF